MALIVLLLASLALIPLGDDNFDRRNPPVVTYGLIAANVFVFVFFQGLGTNEAFTYAYSVVPYEIIHGRDLVGQTGPIMQMPGPHPLSLTILSAMFMHGSIMHIGGNMLYLWIFGDNLEDKMGHVKFLLFYLLCGLIATIAHILSGPGSVVPSLGASGAIAGVLGGYFLLYPTRSVRVLIGYFGIVPLPAFVVIGLWAVLQFYSGLGSLVHTQETSGSGVAYMAHVGGFVAGLLLVRGFVGRDADRFA